MENPTSGERTRRIAIDHHHDVAPVFESLYASNTDRWENAFHYGRHQIDGVLDAELKKLSPGAEVLDIGCGTGQYIRRFVDLGFCPRAIEPAPAMRQRAQRLNPGAEILDGIVTDLPYEDAAFDLVIAIEVFRYLHRSDVQRGLSEMMRVLAPGGAAFITFVNRYALDGFYVLQRVRQLMRRREFDREKPHCEFTTPAEVHADLLVAGAEHIDIHGRLFAPLRLAYKVSRPLAARIARVVEPYDDLLCEQRWMTPFTGHLIAIARK